MQLIIRCLKINGFVVILSLLSISCLDNRLYDLENDVNNFISMQSPKLEFELRLDTISSFEWDELLVASPYTDLNRIEGYNFDEFPNKIKSNDSFIFLGFILNKKGVKWMEIKNSEKSNELFYKTNIYSKSKCLFNSKKLFIDSQRL